MLNQSNKCSVNQSFLVKKDMQQLSRRKWKTWQKMMFHLGTDYVKVLV